MRFGQTQGVLLTELLCEVVSLLEHLDNMIHHSEVD